MGGRGYTKWVGWDSGCDRSKGRVVITRRSSSLWVGWDGA